MQFAVRGACPRRTGPRRNRTAFDEGIRFLHDRLTRILNDLELDGEKTLGGRVDELISSKREAHLRIAALTEAFTKLDTTRQEIGALFASLAATLNTYIAPSLEDHRPNEPG